MSNNDKIILDTVLTKEKEKRAKSYSDSRFYELFVSEKVLVNYDLSYDDLKYGLTGKGGDGGSDGVFPFLNGKLIYEDTDLNEIGNNNHIELYIIQSKISTGFAELVIDKFNVMISDLLDLAKDLNIMKSDYNSQILNNMSCFRDAYKELSGGFPRLSIYFYYATKGDASRIDMKVKRKEGMLIEKCRKLYSRAEVSFVYLGATEMLELASKKPTSKGSLEMIEPPLWCTYPPESKSLGCIGLVKLNKFYSFVCDSNGNKKSSLFESNVRDYQGKREVNREIASTLSNETIEDFWWLNNGITIIAEKIDRAGNTVTIEDPQIVNGLQTSYELIDNHGQNAYINDKRAIMVRIILTNNTESRDKIIKATNSQTSIPSASLRATESIHRKIEMFLFANDVYYDRRKNYYKNQGYDSEKIIGITQLAQAIMAILLKRPDDSRARPSSLLKTGDVYSEIFSDSYEPRMYLNCALLMMKVNKYFDNDMLVDFRDEERRNLKFHVMMYTSIFLNQSVNITANNVADYDIGEVDSKLVKECFAKVANVFRSFKEDKGTAADKTAKSREFVDALVRSYK
ncbi:MAG: AIPR family protein [Nitrospinota bacterium]|nr:AIPR family protein [Nitrospinota bacterium]